MLRRTTMVRGSCQQGALPAHAGGSVLLRRRPAASKLRESSEARRPGAGSVGVVGAPMLAPLPAELLWVAQASSAAACCSSALASSLAASWATRPRLPAAPAPWQQHGAGGEAGGLALAAAPRWGAARGRHLVSMAPASRQGGSDWPRCLKESSISLRWVGRAGGTCRQLCACTPWRSQPHMLALPPPHPRPVLACRPSRPRAPAAPCCPQRSGAAGPAGRRTAAWG